MLELNSFLKLKNVNFHSKEINRKVNELVQNNFILIEENIYCFANYKTEIGSKLDLKKLMI